MKKKNYHHNNLKEDLTSAAIKVISKTGLLNFTLRDIATTVGVSHAATYRHFRSKEALLAYIAETGFRDLVDRTKERIKKAKSPKEKLFLYGEVYVSFAIEKPEHFKIMFGEVMMNSPDYSDLLSICTESFMLLTSILEEIQKSGNLKSKTVLDGTISAWSVVHGLATLYTDRQLYFLKEADPEFSYENLSITVRKSVLYGILKK